MYELIIRYDDPNGVETTQKRTLDSLDECLKVAKKIAVRKNYRIADIKIEKVCLPF